MVKWGFHSAMAPAMDSNSRHCPVCSTALRATGEPYTVDQLFAMWNPVRFSETTIREHRSQSLSTQLHRCPNCQLGIFLPQIIGTPAFYVEAYNLDGVQAQSSFTYSTAKWDFDEALKDVAGCSSAIEVGCGPGFFLERLARAVPDACGTEFNARALATARAKGLMAFGEDEVPRARRGTFDVAFSFHVLEHVRDPVEFLREMLSWISPTGHLGLSVPNQDGPVRYIEPCIQNMPPHHATRWCRQTFEHAAAALGLKIDRVAYEPLSLRDHYYYSTYWVQCRWPRLTGPHACIRALLHRWLPPVFRAGFGMLGLFGVKSTGLLRGQAIYVRLSRRSN